MITLAQLKSEIKTVEQRIERAFDFLSECTEVDARIRLLLIAPKLISAKSIILDIRKALNEINPTKPKEPSQ